MIFSPFKSDLIPPCFSCKKNFSLSQSSLGSEDRIIVFEIPEAFILGDLSSFIQVLSRVRLLP